MDTKGAYGDVCRPCCLLLHPAARPAMCEPSSLPLGAVTRTAREEAVVDANNIGSRAAVSGSPKKQTKRHSNDGREENAVQAKYHHQRLSAETPPAAAKKNATQRSPTTQAWERGVAAIMVDDSTPVCPILHPEHRFRKTWDFAQIFALIYVAVFVPVRTGFDIVLEPGSMQWVVELIVDVYFVADIFVNFRTGFMDDGILEMRTQMIRKKYCQGWLIVDLVSCLPISYITAIAQKDSRDSDDGRSANVKVFKILRLLRLTKLLRLGRLKKIIKRHEEDIENLMGYLKAASGCMLVAYACHIVACFWYFVGGDVESDDGGRPQQGWISREMEGTWAANGNRTADDVGTAERYVTA